MKCVASLLLIVICAGPASAQYLDPTEKATLDYYYSGKTDQIDGARIIDGTITTNKFLASILDLWLPRDGSKAMQAGLPMGGFKITGLGTPAADTDASTKKYVDGRTSATNVIDQYLVNKSQTFTAAAGFEIVTNFSYITRGNFTTTHSNVTVNVAGWYRIDLSASFEATAALVAANGHMFTNSVEVPRIGWSRRITTANDEGSVAGGGLIYLASGTIVDYRLDLDKNSTITFEHISIIYDQR